MKHIFTSLFYAILVFTLVAAARAQTPELPEPPPVPPVLKEVVRANEEARIKVAEEAARKAAEEKAREENPEIDESDVLRVSTSLITVPAEVMDRNGHYIHRVMLPQRRTSRQSVLAADLRGLHGSENHQG